MIRSLLLWIVFVVTFGSAQSGALTESWLVDKSFTKEKIYKVAAGKNMYEAFAISLSLLAQELQSAEQEIQPDAAVVSKTSVTYSFGKTSVQYSRKGFKEQINVTDSVPYHSIQTLIIKVQFTDGNRKATIRYFDEVQEKSSDETFSISKYFSSSNSERTLDYNFQEMGFNSLLNDLKTEGIEIHFINQRDITFALITYPLAKIGK